MYGINKQTTQKEMSSLRIMCTKGEKLPQASTLLPLCLETLKNQDVPNQALSQTVTVHFPKFHNLNNIS